MSGHAAAWLRGWYPYMLADLRGHDGPRVLLCGGLLILAIAALAWWPRGTRV